MASNFGGAVDALKLSLNPRLILRYGLAFILYLVVLVLIAALVFLPAVWVVISPFLEKLAMLEQNPLVILEMIALFVQNFWLILGVLALAAIIFVVLEILWDSLIEATQLNIAKKFVSTQAISFSDAFGESTPTMFKIFKAKLLVGVPLLLLYMVFMLPVIFAVLALMPSAPPIEELLLGTDSAFTQQLNALSTLNSLMGLLYSAVTLFLAPFLLLIVPAIVFDRKGAMQGLKQAWKLSKSNYLNNLVFVIIVGLLELVVAIVGAVAALILFLIVFIPSLFLLGFGAILVAIPLAVILLLFALFWGNTYHFLAMVKFYEFASLGPVKPAPAKPKEPMPQKPVPEKKPETPKAPKKPKEPGPDFF